MALTPMSFEDLEDKLQRDDDPFDLVQLLLWGNESLAALDGWKDWVVECNATPGQRALYLIEVLTGQVDNGGLAQYLHNAPDLVGPLLDTLPIYDWAELGVRLEETLDALPPEVFEGLKRVWRASAQLDGEVFLQSYFEWDSTVDDESFNSWFYSSDAVKARNSKIKDLIRRLRHDFVTG